MPNNPFEKPTTPKNRLQLLQWLIFEPVLLANYEKTLDIKKQKKVVLNSIVTNVLVVIIPLTLVIYAVSVAIIAGFDLPLLFPPDYSSAIYTNKAFVQHWQGFPTWWEKAHFFVSFNDYRSLKGLAVGFAFGFAFGLLGLKRSLAFSLAFSLVFGLVLSLAFGLLVFGCLVAGSFAVCLALGFVAIALAGGLAGGLAIGLAIGLPSESFVFYLVFCLTILGLAPDLALGLLFLAVGLTFPICFYFSYFRLWLYPWHFLKSRGGVSLTKNPYIRDGAIRLPILGLSRKLTTLAQQNPKTGLDFVKFLIKYRPLQQKLAMQIAHAATASTWQHHPLQKQHLLPPPLIKEMPSHTPSEAWLNQIDKLKKQFAAYENEQQVSLKKKQFQQVFEQLQAFKKLTLGQPSRWRHYYLPALEQWLTAAEQRRTQLAEELKTLEPITHNIYCYSDILCPGENNAIFFGRDDIKQQLSRLILTTHTLPLFLFYGQGLVGKSSLLRFLPALLGKRFKVIIQDCQSKETNNLHNWLKDLRQRLDSAFKQKPKTDWQPAGDWLTAWGELQTYLESLCQQQLEKIIIAFDEYEALHDRIFTKDAAQGKKLLEAMRSFSQQQNQVVFLFVGASQFVDLNHPDWNRCFIHAKPVKVDYLKHEDARRLITEPVGLNYSAEVIERMITLTQGHPALLQMCCYHMVNIANKEKRKDITRTDLERVITENILQRGTNALNTFLTEFCQQHQCRATIDQILDHQLISDKRCLMKLEDYGYIIRDGGSWKVRVPLLEMWLRRYREGF
jgi:hypothetical protein